MIYLLLAAVVYFVFFHRLSAFYMRTWDESIYAVNTFEMLQNHNYLVPHLNGSIDPMNDKPPLFFWHQLVSVKLFGYNEFGTRFPSALYGALSVVMLFVFMAKKFNAWLGFSAALVLCCSMGFVTFHSSRTGDMDSMLAFGILGMFIYLVRFVQEQKYVHYLLFGFFVVFAFLTKTLGAFIILPAFYTVMFFSNPRILLQWKFWLINLLMISGIGLFLYLRNQYADHYFNTYFLGYFSRFNKQFNHFHDHPFDYYFNNLVNSRYAVFSVLLLPALFFALREQHRQLRFTVLTAFGSALFMLLVLSLSSSKCYWYDVPLYPLLAVPVAYCIWKFTGLIFMNKRPVAVLLLAFFFIPVYYAVKRSHNNDIGDPVARRCEVIPEYFHGRKGNMPYAEISVADNNYNTPVLFYKYLYRQFNQEIKITDAGQLKPGEIVIAGNDSIKNYISAHYRAEPLETYKNATIYKIKA